MEVYYEPIELDDEITREGVEEETDIARLQDWYDDLNETSIEIHQMISALRTAEVEASPAMARKLGFVNIAKTWVVRRLAELGEEPPHDAISGKTKRLKWEKTMMQQKLEKKNKQIKELRATIEELRSQVRVAA